MVVTVHSIVGKKKPKNLHCTVQYDITEVQ